MARQLTIEEAKSLPMWPEMNRYIKEVLSKEMGDKEFEVVPFEDHWEIHIDGQKVADIGVVFMDKEELKEETNNPNLN